MTVPVLVLNRHPDVCNPLAHWDTAWLWELLAGGLWALDETFDAPQQVEAMEPGAGAVVVVPGRFHASDDDVVWVENQLSVLGWVLLVVTSDEESLMPWWKVRHPRIARWVMTPRPAGPRPDRALGEGWNPATRTTLEKVSAQQAGARSLRWFFSGQVTHERRHQLARVLQGMRRGGRIHQSDSFAAGLPFLDYLRTLLDAKVAPAPAGPATPDSFRLFEALEAGCVPVADGVCPAYPEVGYWDQLFGGTQPFPVVTNWAELPFIVDQVVATWPTCANEVGAWWAGYKRDLAAGLCRTVRHLSGQTHTPRLPITVLVTASPIASHPDTEVLAATIASIKAQPDLHNADVVLVFDGVRAEDEGMAGDYAEHIRRVVWACHHDPAWRNVRPVLCPHHVHQAGAARAAMAHVTTPLVVFMEHDTPLCGPIPWGAMAEVVLSGEVNLVRLMHEAHILEPHKDLMLDKRPRLVGDLPLTRTRQWSQRPHLASSDYYRWVLGSYFGAASSTYIEDVMHGVVQQAWRKWGWPGWRRHKLAIYTPEGDMKRSLHTDGRAGGPKYDDRLVWAYDGDRPPDAPTPTVEWDQ